MPQRYQTTLLCKAKLNLYKILKLNGYKVGTKKDICLSSFFNIKNFI